MIGNLRRLISLESFIPRRGLSEVNEVTKLQVAYKQWQSIDPDCCRCGSHWHRSNPSIYNGPRNWDEPYNDSLICGRELAWRNLVRIRDGNPDWPFSSNKKVEEIPKMPSVPSVASINAYY